MTLGTPLLACSSKCLTSGKMIIRAEITKKATPTYPIPWALDLLSLSLSFLLLLEESVSLLKVSSSLSSSADCRADVMLKCGVYSHLHLHRAALVEESVLVALFSVIPGTETTLEISGIVISEKATYVVLSGNVTPGTTKAVILAGNVTPGTDTVVVLAGNVNPGTTEAVELSCSETSGRRLPVVVAALALALVAIAVELNTSVVLFTETSGMFVVCWVMVVGVAGGSVVTVGLLATETVVSSVCKVDVMVASFAGNDVDVVVAGGERNEIALK